MYKNVYNCIYIFIHSTKLEPSDMSHRRMDFKILLCFYNGLLLSNKTEQTLDSYNMNLKKKCKKPDTKEDCTIQLTWSLAIGRNNQNRVCLWREWRLARDKREPESNGNVLYLDWMLYGYKHLPKFIQIYRFRICAFFCIRIAR